MMIIILSRASTAGLAADKADSDKEAKYRQLANSHISVPVAIETVGTWNNQAVELVHSHNVAKQGETWCLDNS